MLVAPVSGFAAIQFEDVSKSAGLTYHGPTAASSWGDFNGDGWPDLWVSNHHGIPPTLYLNKRDGTFAEITDAIVTEHPDADFHGAAWADFDNDGDQDLIAVTGGGAGRGVSPNQFFINDHGRLVNEAKKFGLDYRMGRGRLPLWVDVNKDGMLDVLLINRDRAEAPSAIFVQTPSGFVRQNKEYGFQQPKPAQDKGIFTSIKEIFHSSNSSGKQHGVMVNEEFAQLADLADAGGLELVAYMKPMRVYSIRSEHFQDITDQLSVPASGSVEDAAIEDFDGDGRMDWFLVRSQPWAMDIVQTSQRHVQGKVVGKPKHVKTVKFRTDGVVSFGLYRPWMDPTDPRRNEKPGLFIGSRQLTLENPVVTVRPDDPEARQPVPDSSKQGENIAIAYDPGPHVWTLTSSVRLISFEIDSTEPIDWLDIKGFKPSKGALKDVFLVNDKGKFNRHPMGLTDYVTACGSVVAGDFDNDMDMDLYLVCAGPTENFPNILYENDGHGNFTKVPEAGGAAGSDQGRGNQAVAADFDQDGFLDLFVTNGGGPPPFANRGPHQLFHNVGNGNHWLEIDLQGVKSNRDGVGAEIALEAGGKVQVRMQGGGMHSFSQNYKRIHFGLGPNAVAQKMTITWPSGVVQELRNIKADQILTVKEDANDRQHGL